MLVLVILSFDWSAFAVKLQPGEYARVDYCQPWACMRLCGFPTMLTSSERSSATRAPSETGGLTWTILESIFHLCIIISAPQHQSITHEFLIFALVGEQCVRRLVPSIQFMGTRLPNYGNETSPSPIVFGEQRITYESSSTERSKKWKQANKETKKWIVDFERLVSYPCIALYPGLPPYGSLIWRGDNCTRLVAGYYIGILGL